MSSSAPIHTHTNPQTLLLCSSTHDRGDDRRRCRCSPIFIFTIYAYRIPCGVHIRHASIRFATYNSPPPPPLDVVGVVVVTPHSARIPPPSNTSSGRISCRSKIARYPELAGWVREEIAMCRVCIRYGTVRCCGPRRIGGGWRRQVWRT